MYNVMTASPFAVDRNGSNVDSGIYVGIFYQNVRGHRTKSVYIF
jgi:hypothetical protein